MRSLTTIRFLSTIIPRLPLASGSRINRACDCTAHCLDRTICLICLCIDLNQNLISPEEPRSKRRVVTCPDRFAYDPEPVFLNPGLKFLLVFEVELFAPNAGVSDGRHLTDWACRNLTLWSSGAGRASMDCDAGIVKETIQPPSTNCCETGDVIFIFSNAGF